MARLRNALGVLLCTGAIAGMAGLATAQSNTGQIRTNQVQSAEPSDLKLQMKTGETQAKVAAALKGISVDDVIAEVGEIERAPRDGAAGEIHEQAEVSARPVTRADIDALKRVRPSARLAGAPDNVLPIAGDRVRPARPNLPSAGEKVQIAPKPSLDLNAFGQELHAALGGNVQGYTLRVRQNGKNIYTLQWNWARIPGEGQRGWNPSRRQNVASVSKFITAIALVDLLQKRGINPDSSIAPWLPAYWDLGPNIQNITFAMLMRQRSNIVGKGTTDMGEMRKLVEAGVGGPLPATFKYENANFGIQRILIATLGGYVNRNLTLGKDVVDDPIWASATIAAYKDYVSKNVFAPAGVKNAGFTKNPDMALAYAYNGGLGWNSGNASWRAGSGGWHLSVDEILDVVGTFRRGGSIVSPQTAQAAIESWYGIDDYFETAMGRVYHKNGSWSDQKDCPAGKRQEQSLLMILPDNIEMAVLVNSPIGPNCTFLRGLVQQLIIDNVIVP